MISIRFVTSSAAEKGRPILHRAGYVFTFHVRDAEDEAAVREALFAAILSRWEPAGS